MRTPRLVAALLVALACLFVLPATAFAAERSDTAPLAPAPLGGGSPLFFASSGSRCVAAFAATGGGNGFLITGIGCGTPGETVTSGNNIVVGVVTSAPISAAVTVVRVTNTVDWVLVGRVDGVVIGGSTEAPVGATVCMLGSTTGRHCGTITAKNQTVAFPTGVITGLTRTTVCSEPGDGGAPFFSGDQAQGILVGGSGNCTVGGTTFFQPINPILAAFGITLLAG